MAKKGLWRIQIVGIHGQSVMSYTIPFWLYCRLLDVFKKTTKTMKILSILIVFISLISCQELQNKRNINFVSKVESIGLDKFKYIEFYTRGENEVYRYYLTNDSSISWIYNREIKKFEYPAVNQDLKKVANNFQDYIINLRKEMQLLNFIAIMQSPWPGNIIGFWISIDEKIEYVNPEFKFDDRFKNEWLKEIQAGQKLKYNWYYIKLKK